MIKTVGFVVRNDDYSHEEFVERFRGQHVELGKRLPGLVKYTTSVPTDPPGRMRRRGAGSRDVSVPDAGLVEYDIVSELWFEDVDAYREAFPSDASERAFLDEEEFMEEIYFVTVEEAVHVDEA